MGRRTAVLEDPAGVLAGRLRAAGRADLAVLLTEVIPNAPGDDEHLPLLADRLARIAAEATLEAPVRDEAARLAAVAADLPAAIGRAGQVWIAWWQPRRAGDEAGHYGCHWAAEPDEDDLYESGPDTASLAEALAWARRRAAHVVVRPAWDSANHYWAGEGPCPGDRYPPL